MSIDTGVPDLENEAKDSDKADEELEIEDSSRPDLRKKGEINFGDIKYKVIQRNLMKLSKLKILKM